ncbi:MAG: BofC C-terminal domain-containing protein [Oscillospiraceae bacterium]|nr:BofC C-terminal domain-containing protein [Oscillospiraceae bacterium]
MVIFFILTIFVASAHIISPPGETNLTYTAETGLPASNNADDVLNNDAEETEVPEDIVYILKEYNGLVAIYFGGAEGEPGIITEITVSKLRRTDAESLRAGIEVAGAEELAKIIEDLNS